MQICPLTCLSVPNLPAHFGLPKVGFQLQMIHPEASKTANSLGKGETGWGPKEGSEAAKLRGTCLTQRASYLWQDGTAEIAVA